LPAVAWRGGFGRSVFFSPMDGGAIPESKSMGRGLARSRSKPRPGLRKCKVGQNCDPHSTARRGRTSRVGSATRHVLYFDKYVAGFQDAGHNCAQFYDQWCFLGRSISETARIGVPSGQRSQAPSPPTPLESCESRSSTRVYLPTLGRSILHTWPSSWGQGPAAGAPLLIFPDPGRLDRYAATAMARRPGSLGQGESSCSGTATVGRRWLAKEEVRQPG